MSYASFGTPGWDPVSSLKCEGLAYFMPGIAKLALYRGSHRDYVGQFCSNMDAERMLCFSAEQRAAMLEFLQYFRASRETDMRSELDGHELLNQLDRCIHALGS